MLWPVLAMCWKLEATTLAARSFIMPYARYGIPVKRMKVLVNLPCRYLLFVDINIMPTSMLVFVFHCALVASEYKTCVITCIVSYFDFGSCRQTPPLGILDNAQCKTIQ